MDTKDIIQAIKNNESKQLMVGLYKTALPPIIQFVRKKKGSRSDAEDCFQEAVMVLIKKVRSSEFDQNYEVKNFLFVVARNIWFNKLKKDIKMQTSDIEDFTIESQNLIGDELMINEEKESAMLQLMNLAGERCKELLNYYLFENKKLKEIAELMGFSSEEVVKTNHYRCKQKLKEALKNDTRLIAALRI